jgi:hypothetical protein
MRNREIYGKTKAENTSIRRYENKENQRIQNKIFKEAQNIVKWQVHRIQNT